jgi:hypothetical protein
MIEQNVSIAGKNLPAVDAGMDSWQLAKKRADNYLKLHQIVESEREKMLAQVMQKLMRLAPCSEQALIERFLNIVRQELAAQQAQNIKSAEEESLESRGKTSPRFERSSIRVAPLKTINLRLLRPLQRTH